MQGRHELFVFRVEKTNPQIKMTIIYNKTLTLL